MGLDGFDLTCSMEQRFGIPIESAEWLEATGGYVGNLHDYLCERMEVYDSTTLEELQEASLERLNQIVQQVLSTEGVVITGDDRINAVMPREMSVQFLAASGFGVWQSFFSRTRYSMGMLERGLDLNNDGDGRFLHCLTNLEPNQSGDNTYSDVTIGLRRGNNSLCQGEKSETERITLAGILWKSVGDITPVEFYFSSAWQISQRNHQ